MLFNPTDRVLSTDTLAIEGRESTFYYNIYMWQSQVENEQLLISLIQLALLVLCFEHTAKELVYL